MRTVDYVRADVGLLLFVFASRAVSAARGVQRAYAATAQRGVAAPLTY